MTWAAGSPGLRPVGWEVRGSGWSWDWGRGSRLGGSGQGAGPESPAGI